MAYINFKRKLLINQGTIENPNFVEEIQELRGIHYSEENYRLALENSVDGIVEVVPEETDNQPTQIDKLEATVTYMAIMLDMPLP